MIRTWYSYKIFIHSLFTLIIILKNYPILYCIHINGINVWLSSYLPTHNYGWLIHIIMYIIQMKVIQDLHIMVLLIIAVLMPISGKSYNVSMSVHLHTHWCSYWSRVLKCTHLFSQWLLHFSCYIIVFSLNNIV